MPLAFAHPPADPSGDWLCDLPDDCCIGEVIAYAQAATVVPPVDHFIWRLDQSTYPLTEVSGFNHQCTGATSGLVSFHQPSLRTPPTGYAIAQTSGTINLDWTPPVTTIGREWGLAVLMRRDWGAVEGPTASLSLNGIMGVRRRWSAVGGDVVAVFLNGIGLLLETGSITTLQDTPFIALTVATNGATMRYFGTGAGSSYAAQPAYNPAGTWAIHLDATNPSRFQEIHVWDRLPTDAEILAVRNDLIGV